MAAEDIKGKKRKGAQDVAPKAKKPRKSDDVAAAPRPTRAVKVVPAAAASKPVKGKPARKEAADFFSDNEAPAAEPVEVTVKPTKGKKKVKVAVATNGDATEPAVTITVAEEPKAQDKPKKQGKKAKAVADTNGDVPELAVAVTVAAAPKAQDKPKKQGKKAKALDVEEAVAAEAPAEKAKPAKKSKKAEVAPVEEEEVTVEAPVKKSKKVKGGKKQEEPSEEVSEVITADEVDGEVEEDDQTAALLAGFESDDDEAKDPENDADFDENATVPALTKKQRTALEKATQGPRSNVPGVIYIGRVPRGFFEPQMKKYFSQFGRIKRLRLSRNKQTGASKHYAFVEFQSTEVADIVARTMDNYLLFGHILRCKLIPEDQVHPDLFKGAGQRFKVDPRNKKAGLQMERGVERAQWEKRVETENKRRTGRNKQLKDDFGYEFGAPNVKAVSDVPMQLENGEPQQELTEAPVEEVSVAELPKAKKGKKAAKASTEQQPAENAQSLPQKKSKQAAKENVAVEAEVQAEIAAEVAAPILEKKAKKDKKRKSDVTVESTVVVEETIPVETTPKTKKAKKNTEDVPVAEDAEEKKRKAKPEQDVAKPKKAKKAKA